METSPKHSRMVFSFPNWYDLQPLTTIRKVFLADAKNMVKKLVIQGFKRDILKKKYTALPIDTLVVGINMVEI